MNNCYPIYTKVKLNFFCLGKYFPSLKVLSFYKLKTKIKAIKIH